MVVHACITADSIATDVTPNKLVLGMRPTILADRVAELKVDGPNTEDREDYLTKYWDLVAQSGAKLEKRKKMMIKEGTNAKFQPKDFVMVKVSARGEEGHAKFSDRWKGPYEILHVSASGSYSDYTRPDQQQKGHCVCFTLQTV